MAPSLLSNTAVKKKNLKKPFLIKYALLMDMTIKAN